MKYFAVNRSLTMLTIYIATLFLLLGNECVTAEESTSTGKNKNTQRFDPAKRYVIIHSDDAGMSHSVNLATIEGMEKGTVSSCSMMVPCPWFPEFAKYAKNHPEKDYGIHLTLNSEFKNYRWGPVAPRDKVPSLCDPEGYLWRDKKSVVQNARAEEVELELRAQIDRALKAGIRLSHLDTHMGTVISRADMLEIYVRLGVEYGLPVMMIRKIDPIVGRAYPELMAKHRGFIEVLEKEKLPVLDMLHQYYSGDNHEKREALYLKTLRESKPGVTQIIIHCGYDDRELQGITSSHFLRGDDTRIFTDPKVRAEIEKMGIEVVSWTELSQMQRVQSSD